MRSAARLSFGVVLSAALLPASARADEVATCVKASEQAQSLRDEGKYKKARELLLVCSREVCPGIVKKDCTQWLTEVDGSMPSIVITARDGSGKDLLDVKISVDGLPFAERLDGKPLTIDPGEHTIRYEAPGAPASEEKIVMHAGEKNRALTVRIGPGAPPPPAEAPPLAPPPRDHRDAGNGGGIPPAAFVVGGIGVLAIGSFAFFGLSGRKDVSDLRSSCAPNCDQSKVDSARSKLIIADVSLAAGVVALGVATWIVLSSNSKPPAAVSAALAHVDVRPVAGGGVAAFGARF